jgi:hypothetical protein
MVPQLDEITHTWGIVPREFRDVRLGADGPLKGLPEFVEVGVLRRDTKEQRRQAADV